MAARTLIVADAAPGFHGQEDGDLLLLSSDPAAADGWAGARTLDGARLVDRSADVLRNDLPRWASALGEARVRGRSLKEWLLFPGTAASAWWFTALAERNPLKTDAFLRLAQILAVERLLPRYEEVLLVLGDRRLRHALGAMARRRGLAVRARPARGAGKPERGLAGTALRAAAWLAVFMGRALAARRARRPSGARALFVTYFPAGEGNKYLGPVAAISAAAGEEPAWLYLYVPAEGASFRDALRMRDGRARAGEDVRLLHEFLTFRALRRTLARWARGVFLWARLGEARSGAFLAAGFFPPEAGEALGPLWRESLLGWTGLEGALYLSLFEEALDRFPSCRRAVYVAEMHPWERALNAARAGRGLKTVGFQHTAVAPNYFFYFHDPRDAARSGKPEDLPLPDVLACNGGVPCGLLKASSYPGLRPVEAVRHLALAGVLGRPPSAKASPPVVLVAGSIDAGETRALLGLWSRAFPGKAGFRALFKPHPALEAGAVPPGLETVRRPLEELLTEASVLVAGVTSAAIDALAHGCRVVCPVLPDALFLSPLGGREELCQKVYTAEDLKVSVEKALSEGAAPEAGRRFAASYWNLDPALPLWRDLLTSTRGETP